MKRIKGVPTSPAYSKGLAVIWHFEIALPTRFAESLNLLLGN